MTSPNVAYASPKKTWQHRVVLLTLSAHGIWNLPAPHANIHL